MLTDVYLLHDKDVTSLPCVWTDVWMLCDKDVTSLPSVLTDVWALQDKDATSLPCVLTDVWALQDKDVTASLCVLTDVWALLGKNVTELSCVLTGSRVLQRHPRGPVLFWTVQRFRRSQVPMRHLSGQDAACHLQRLFCHRGRGPLFQLNRGRDEWFCCSSDCTRHFLRHLYGGESGSQKPVK